MAASSKEEYLKKYLSVNAEEKKKKKKRKPGLVPAKIVKSRIVDDDVDFKSLLPENLANTLEEDVGDNEPIIADFVDERPEHVKLLEKYRTSGAWKVLGEDDENSSEGHDSDSDQSPPRRKRHDSDSDQSLPRRKRHDSDSDQSPRRRKRHDSDSDQSLPRRKTHDSDSDQSPPRRKTHDSDSDQSPPRRKRHDSDSDQSPPRKKSKDSNLFQSNKKRTENNKSSSSARNMSQISGSKSNLKKKRHNSDSDQSPPRRRRPNSDSDQSPPRRRRHNSNSDLSPPRKKSTKEKDSSPQRRKRRDADSDNAAVIHKSHKHSSTKNRFANKDEEKTLSGKRAGLSSAQEMRREAEELKRKEDAKFREISDERLGKGAATVFRDKSGRKRDLAEEKLKQSEEAKKKAKENEKFQKWGKGLKQIEEQSVQVQDALHEANKPLARYKDDEDLDEMLRNMDRAEDPMLAFITKKKSKNAGPPRKEKPRYKGPAPPPNRFGIMPGYRWDGVDRSNGFEKQVYSKQAERKATSEQAYKWSVEDM